MMFAMERLTRHDALPGGLGGGATMNGCGKTRLTVENAGTNAAGPFDCATPVISWQSLVRSPYMPSMTADAGVAVPFANVTLVIAYVTLALWPPTTTLPNEDTLNDLLG